MTYERKTDDCINHDGHHAAPGRQFCKWCEQTFIDAIDQLAPDLFELHETALRLAKIDDGDTGKGMPPFEAPSPINEAKWELYAEAKETIHQAAAVAGLDVKADPVTLLLAFKRRPDVILQAPGAIVPYQDLTALADRVHKAVNPEPPRVAYGLCPFCDGTVWGYATERAGECNRCGARIPRTMVHDKLMARLEQSDVRGTPKELSRACAACGVRLPAATIRTWVHRNRIQLDDDGTACMSDLIPLIKSRATVSVKM